jgi:hypothetical protein
MKEIYEILATFPITEWAEVRIERVGRRYLAALTRRRYAKNSSGTDRKEIRITKVEALRLAREGSLEDFARYFDEVGYHLEVKARLKELERSRQTASAEGCPPCVGLTPFSRGSLNDK